jgi:predicted DNA-binding transcriptional regulator YafY
MAKSRVLLDDHARRSISVERTARLYRLLRLLGARPQTRTELMRRLRLDIRGFYRDLELLRNAGIQVSAHNNRYSMRMTLASALEQLPFPDPGLSLGEAVRLSRGRSAAHNKVKALLTRIVV